MTSCRNRKCGRPTDVFLCQECGDQLVAALDRVEWLDDELSVTELRQDRVSRGLRSGRAPRSPLLFDPTAGELRARLVNSVNTWARHIAETRRVRVGWPAAEWLADNIDAVRLDEAAGELYRDITRDVAAGLALINAAERTIYRGPCPTVVGRTASGAPVECATPLYADAEAEIAYSSSTDTDRQSPAAWVTCPNCGVLHDTARLEARLLARSDHLAFDVPSLVRILRELGEPVLRNTIDQWIRRGKLTPAAWRHDGRTVARQRADTDKPLYRLGAVRKLRAAGSRGKTA